MILLFLYLVFSFYFNDLRYLLLKANTLNNSQYTIDVLLYLVFVHRTRQSKQNSSRCSIDGINGKIDPPSEYDEVDEEVIYSQESPNMVEVYRDFDWELDRFVEYRFTIKKPL
jgi:hypothetical protein